MVRTAKTTVGASLSALSSQTIRPRRSLTTGIRRTGVCLKFALMDVSKSPTSTEQKGDVSTPRRLRALLSEETWFATDVGAPRVPSKW